MSKSCGVGLLVGSMTRTPTYQQWSRQDVTHSWGSQLPPAKTTPTKRRGCGCARVAAYARMNLNINYLCILLAHKYINII